MKEIGSIFPLYKENYDFDKDAKPHLEEKGKVLYSLCREALLDIVRVHDNVPKTVLLPAYTCMTVVDPFLQMGWECVYYAVDRNLRINEESIIRQFDTSHPSVIVVHPYFGMDLNEHEIGILKKLKERGCIIVVDLTQCVFSKQRLPFVDYYVGSIRKWMSVPDGAFLETSQTTATFQPSSRDEYVEFVTRQGDSMYLRGLYFGTGDEQTKEISRRLNKEAVEMTHGRINPHAMAGLSYAIWKHENYEEIEKRRRDNFHCLISHLLGSDDYQPVCHDFEEVTTAPLYFCIYARDRALLQQKLIRERIYAPVIWPLGLQEMLVSEDVQYIYEHILAIPIDQRYDREDMMWIIEKINK